MWGRKEETIIRPGVDAQNPEFLLAQSILVIRILAWDVKLTRYVKLTQDVPSASLVSKYMEGSTHFVQRKSFPQSDSGPH